MTDLVHNGAEPKQELVPNLRALPDGSHEIIFALKPSGQVIGSLRVWAAAPQVLAMMAATFSGWAHQQAAGALQVAPAGTLGQLDRLRAPNGAN